MLQRCMLVIYLCLCLYIASIILNYLNLPSISPSSIVARRNMAFIKDTSIADLCADGCIETNESHPYLVEVFDLVAPGCS